MEVNFGGGDDIARIIGDIDEGIVLDLDGGEGEDTLDLSEVTPGSTVDLSNVTGFETIIGSEGVDIINGGAEANVVNAQGGDDTVAGGAGDDELVGNLGNDEVRGEEGDDLLVWNNGDGSDLLNGGEGDDRVQVNFQNSTDLSDTDLQNDDEATIAGDGAGGITFNRVAVNGQNVNGLFQLDIEETETVEVNFGGGMDVARIIGDIDEGIALDLDGGDGIDALSFAELNVEDDDEGVEINLGTGEIASIKGAASESTAANFEFVIGSDANDAIVGSDQSNIIQGGEGTDDLTGGGGVDLFVFQLSLIHI